MLHATRTTPFPKPETNFLSHKEIRMSLEPRSRSRAGDGMGSLCLETKPGLCSGTHTPLPSTVSSDLLRARMIQIKVRMLYLACTSNESRTPNFTARLFVPGISKQPNQNRKREKTTFYLYPTSLMEVKTEAVWKSKTWLFHTSRVGIKSFRNSFIYLYLFG